VRTVNVLLDYFGLSLVDVVFQIFNTLLMHRIRYFTFGVKFCNFGHATCWIDSNTILKFGHALHVSLYFITNNFGTMSESLQFHKSAASF